MYRSYASAREFSLFAVRLPTENARTREESVWFTISSLLLRFITSGREPTE